MKYLALAALFLGVLASPAQARHYHRHAVAPTVQQPFNFFGGWFQQPFAPPINTTPARKTGGHLRTGREHARTRRERSTTLGRTSEGEAILPHPDGCPHRQFCGCGAAIRIFGHNVRSLWTARSWFRFPHVQKEHAMPGMAAVRQHHVMVLEADMGNGMWKVYDANSGHHLTRMHAHSLAGYRIVNPRGG